MSEKKIIIAIDGYSGCGKSTTAKLVAKELGYSFIDTGAMYRATTLYFLDNYIRITNPKDVEKALEKIDISFVRNGNDDDCQTFLNGKNVSLKIREMRVTEKVSKVAALKPVRDAMVTQQQKMGKNKALVMDGRDIGTNVFPEAELKIFMDADMDVRAGRRQRELLDKGQVVDLKDIIHNLQERDHIDTTRKESPLRKAEDAISLNTTNFSINNQVTFVLEHFRKVIEKSN